MTAPRRKDDAFVGKSAAENASGAPHVINSGLKTLSWRDSLVSTSHADIVVRQTLGTKLPILFLHGGGLCKEVFDRQIASSLGLEYRMIAIDLPGHGESGDAFEPDRTYRIEGLADVALEVLEALGVDYAVVVGAALGGLVGLRMLEFFPGLVGLALTATPLVDPSEPSPQSMASELFGFGPVRETDLADAEIDAFVRRSVGEPVGAPFTRAVRRVDIRAKTLLHRDIEGGLAEPWRPAANAVATPIMLVNGDEAGSEEAERAAMPRAEGRGGQPHYVIPHAGPAPYRKVPSVYNHLLQGFMERMEHRHSELLETPTLWYGG